MHPGPDVGKHATHGLDHAQVAQRVQRLQRVVVELALVVDPALAGPEHEFLVRQDLVPEGLHYAHLGKEAVAADVETPPVALHGPADPPDHAIGLQHRRTPAALISW